MAFKRPSPLPCAREKETVFQAPQADFDSIFCMAEGQGLVLGLSTKQNSLSSSSEGSDR